jgi:UTP:GlnB (protein PII) uridylyltransferase
MKHRAGMGGREVTLYRSELLDHLVCEMYSESLGKDTTSQSNTAVIAIGGYGRRELAPFSDVDLMFLVKSRRSQKEAQQIQFMLYKLQHKRRGVCKKIICRYKYNTHLDTKA